jgi:hypothetical protein
MVDVLKGIKDSVSQVFWCNEHENESILSEMDEIDEISQF